MQDDIEHRFIYYPKRRLLFFCAWHDGADGEGEGYQPLFVFTPEDWLHIMEVLAYIAMCPNSGDSLQAVLNLWHEIEGPTFLAESMLVDDQPLEHVKLMLKEANIPFVGMEEGITGWSKEMLEQLAETLKGTEEKDGK